MSLQDCKISIIFDLEYSIKLLCISTWLMQFLPRTGSNLTLHYYSVLNEEKQWKSKYRNYEMILIQKIIKYIFYRNQIYEDFDKIVKICNEKGCNSQQAIQVAKKEKLVDRKTLKRLQPPIKRKTKIKMQPEELNNFFKNLIINYNDQNIINTSIINVNNYNESDIKIILEKQVQNINMSTKKLFEHYCILANNIVNILSLKKYSYEYIMTITKYKSKNFIKKLEWLGNIGSKFPKIMHINITLTEFINNRKNITELFSDKYKDINIYWSNVNNLEDNENEENEENDMNISNEIDNVINISNSNYEEALNLLEKTDLSDKSIHKVVEKLLF